MNDPAFIRHTESPDNTAVMSFSVGDNDATNDYFVFGNASSGFVERFKITATGVVTIGTWNGTAIGDTYISSASTWNGKVSSVSATSPVLSSGGTTPTISIPAATTSVSGYLTSTDWTTFNNKGTFTLPSLTSGSVLFSNGSTIAQDNANFFWDDTNNRLGIGNAAPSHPLDVTGIIKGSTSIYATNDLFIGDTTGSATGRLIITDSSNQGVNIRRNNAVSERFKLFVGNGTTYTQDNAIILGTNTDIDFYTGSSPVKRLTIANSGAATFSSSVAGVTGNFTNSTSGNTFIIGTTYAGGRNIQIGISDGSILPTAAAYINDNTGVGVYIGDNSAATKGLYVKNGGNVGIGTTSPYSVLDIKTASSGSQKLFSVGEPTYEASNYGLVLRGDNNTGVFAFYGVNATVETTAPILAMRRSSGNVGIGTSSPSTLFHTYSATDNLSTLEAGTSGGIQIRFKHGSTQTAFINSNTSEIFSIFQGTSTERFAISTSGNVGLSRTATTNTLEVNGNASKTTAGSWLANSDINIKTDINTIDGALDRINKVRLVSFKYKDAYKEGNRGIKDKYYHNVIAQEFQEIYPDYVYDSGDVFEEHKVLQVDTNPMYVDSVSAIQELSKMVIELQNQINELKNK
jgi:hypothetical protein